MLLRATIHVAINTEKTVLANPWYKDIYRHSQRHKNR